MKMKKSQMEIMGLVIVILLVSVGMLFLVSISIKNKPDTIKLDYNNVQLASNIINAMLDTNTICDYHTFSELIQDFATESYLITSCPGGLNSKDFFDSTIKNTIFNKTLDTWEKKYNFVIYVDNEDNVVYGPIRNYDGPVKKVQSEAFVLPARGQDIFIKLDILT